MDVYLKTEFEETSLDKDILLFAESMEDRFSDVLLFKPVHESK